MIIRTVVVLCGSALLLSSCFPTTKGYRQLVNSWIGSNEESLIESWGVPIRSYSVSNNKKYIVYSDSRSITLPATSPTYYADSLGYIHSYGGSPASELAFNCETTFLIQDAKVKSVSFEGNDCTAQEED